LKIKLNEIGKERLKKYINLRKMGYKLKKLKKLRDAEKSKIYVEFVSGQIKKRKNKFKIKV
jgi:hypothetical protein